VSVLKRSAWFRGKTHLHYIWPALLVLFLLTVIPTAVLIYLSLTNYELGSPSASYVGFANFKHMLSGQDKVFWPSVKLSLGFMLVVTAAELLLGFFLATLLNRDFRGKALVFACLIVPIAMTPSITGQIWKLMLNSEYGVVNYLLQSAFHTKVVWLSSEYAMLSTVLVDIWQNTPFVAIILYAGLRSLPAEPYEAAMVDGAGKWSTFVHLTLPLLKPVLLLAILFRIMDSLKTFDIPFTLTQGGPGTATEFLSLHVYRLGFAHTGWIGRASAASFILLVFIGILCFLLVGILRKGSEKRG